MRKRQGLEGKKRKRRGQCGHMLCIMHEQPFHEGGWLSMLVTHADVDFIDRSEMEIIKKCSRETNDLVEQGG